MPPLRSDVVVIGAGPHGLAATAHLRAAGVDTMIFGTPLEFWATQMPRGMLLRSSYRACYIADAGGALTLAKYDAQCGINANDQPVPLERFIDYGMWFQRAVAADVDQRKVVAVERAGGEEFVIRLGDGEQLRAGRVIVAAGIAGFAHRPAMYNGLSSRFVSHTADHRDFDDFAGRRVVVVGAGQSALESAALLHESGAEVEVVSRGAYRWITPIGQPNVAGTRERIRSLVPAPIRRPLRYVRYPPHDVGRLPWNWLVASPDVWRLLPRAVQPTVEYKVNYPRGAAWLPARLRDVPLHEDTEVAAVHQRDGALDVSLSDGTRRVVDHVLLGTGYRIDVSRYDFLQPVLRQLRIVNGYPILNSGMESSVPGLHFMGAPAARSLGPVMRFVAGTAYGARAIKHAVLRERRPLIDFSW